MSQPLNQMPFGDAARAIIRQAQAEARRFGQSDVRTEHLLLAILSQPGSIASQALRELGVAYDDVTTVVEMMIGHGSGSPEHIPYHMLVKKAFGTAFVIAGRMHDSVIAPEHILLSLIEDGEGAGAHILLEQFSLPVLQKKIAEVCARQPRADCADVLPNAGELTVRLPRDVVDEVLAFDGTPDESIRLLKSVRESVIDAIEDVS